MKSVLSPMPKYNQLNKKKDKIVEYWLFGIAALLTVVWLTVGF